jgi:ornithine decarboxylase
MTEVIAAQQMEEPLYVVDLGAVARLYQAWTVALPRVMPFYAVKCFPDRAIVATLAALGAGFDCASETEVILSTPNVIGMRNEK